MNTIIVKYIAIILLICIVTIGKGQNTSAPVNSLQTEQTLPKIHNPHKATIYSALIPGLGQVYNKKYWKLPIIYGATGILIYAFDLNNTEYHKFRAGIIKLRNGEITSFEGYTDDATLVRIRDSFQRDRDFNVILLAALYMLNIIDATVDAHMFDYSISDDLSLNVQPTLKRTYANQSTIGISLNFSF